MGLVIVKKQTRAILTWLVFLLFFLTSIFVLYTGKIGTTGYIVIVCL